MKLNISGSTPRMAVRLPAWSVLLCLLFSVVPVRAQNAEITDGPASVTVPAPAAVPERPLFRVETVSISAGAELITVLARGNEENEGRQGPVVDVPLISVLKDTLGDEIPENDRLRYVWMHTYTEPSFRQKAAAFIPFLYKRTSDRKVGNEPPPVVLDLQPSDKIVWNKIFWFLFKRMVISDFALGAKASTLQYHQNASDHHRAAIADSLAALSLFAAVEGEKVLSETELADIQARLVLKDKTFGWRMQSENLQRVYEEDRRILRDLRGHNWELLRQYSEAQGLYFEPLVMQDGFARHAIVWTTEADVKANQGKSFDPRFLNIKNPWKDARLAKWDGYKQVRWFDAEDRQVDADTPGATAKTMIPLALYGLDYPKIPVILVDFRDTANPKIREVSRRVLADVTNTFLSLSRFSSLPYFVGRFVYEFITARRGIDLNQDSRFRSYSQLRLLLSLDESLDPELRREVSRQVNSAGINPLQNDPRSGSEIARKQYANLLAYAERPDGLSKKIVDDRRAEMARVKHSRTERTFFAISSVLSLGLYTHREKETPELMAKMDQRRQLDHHERYIRQVAFASAGPEIDTDMEQLERSLSFVAENGTAAEAKTTRALAKIFAVSRSEAMQQLCLAGLYRINNSSAKKQLLAIYNASKENEKWRNVSAGYLTRALEEGQRISSRDVPTIAAISKGGGY